VPLHPVTLDPVQSVRFRVTVPLVKLTLHVPPAVPLPIVHSIPAGLDFTPPLPVPCPPTVNTGGEPTTNVTATLCGLLLATVDVTGMVAV